MVRLFRASHRRGQWDRALGYSKSLPRPPAAVSCALGLGLSCLLLLQLCLTRGFGYVGRHGLRDYELDVPSKLLPGQRRLLSADTSGQLNWTYNGKCEIVSASSQHGFSLETCDVEIATGYRGAFIALYVFLTILMFIAVAIVCDDFFVPSLEAISERLHLSEDVAGATFMAAGSSAPELFSSVAAVAMDSDAGVGTIAGSAVFNILVIISLSAAFAGRLLKLDWRPLARDSVFYLISIIYFIIMVMDSLMQIYEAVVLLIIYALYIVVMVFNPRLMDKLAMLEDTCCSRVAKVEPAEMEAQVEPVHNEQAAVPTQSAGSLRSVKGEGRVFKHDRRNSLLLSLHGSKPSLRGSGGGGGQDGQTEDRRESSVVAASTPQLRDGGVPVHRTDSGVPSSGHNSTVTLSEGNVRNLHQNPLLHMALAPTRGSDSPSTGTSLLTSPGERAPIEPIGEEMQPNDADKPPDAPASSGQGEGDDADGDKNEKEEEEEEEEPRIQCCCPCCPDIRGAPPQRTPDMGAGQWTVFVLKWIVFVLAFPFLCAYSWTIPDCSKPHLRKYFLVSFFISVLWIAGISFVMVTVVAKLGCLLGIDTFVMSLTVLAAGTSIPDLLSSIIVARDGFADMAVSNAIGSNVFDIDMGLGLPFLLRLIINKGEPLDVFSAQERKDYCEGRMKMVVHVKFGIILIIILFLTVGMICAARFKVGKPMAAVLFILYILFLVYAFLQQFLCTYTC